MLGALPSISLLDRPSMLGGSNLLKKMEMGMPDLMMPSMPEFNQSKPAAPPKSYEQNDFVAKVTLPMPKK